MSQLATRTMGVFDRLTSLFTLSTLAGTPESRNVERTPFQTEMPDNIQTYLGQYYNWRNMPESREAEMRFYDWMEQELPEIDVALNAYATMATTGASTGAKRNSFVAKVDRDKLTPELEKRLARFNGMMQRHAFPIIRGMAQYGSFPAAIKIGPIGTDAEGRPELGVVDLTHLPPGTMHRQIDVRGRGDDQQYWYQRIDGKDFPPVPRWQIPHFALWTKTVNADHTLLYGTSVLRRVGRSAMEVSAMNDGMVVARLTRATMKHVHTIDCTDLSGKDYSSVIERLNTVRNSHQRQRVRMPNGSMNSYQRAPIQEEDWYIASFANRNSGIDKIEGDMNLSNIEDVRFVYSRFLGGINVPPEYLGQERSQGGRSVLSQIDVQFARTGRFLQWCGAAGFEHVLYVDLIMGGYDPDQLNAMVLPPPMGARDDLLRAQVLNLHSQVLVNLRTAGMDLGVNPGWVMRVFMDLDDELEQLADQELDGFFPDLPEPLPAAGTGNSQRRAAESLIANLSSDEIAIIRKDTSHYVKRIKNLLGPTGDAMKQEQSRNRDSVEICDLATAADVRRSMELCGLI